MTQKNEATEKKEPPTTEITPAEIGEMVVLVREIHAQNQQMLEKMERVEATAIKRGMVAGGVAGGISGTLTVVLVEFIRAKLGY